MMGFSPEMLAMLQGLGGMQGGTMGALGEMVGQLGSLPPDVGAILGGGEQYGPPMDTAGPMKSPQAFPWEAAGTAALGAAGMPLAQQNRQNAAALQAAPRGGLPVAGGMGRGLQAAPFRLPGR